MEALVAAVLAVVGLVAGDLAEVAVERTGAHADWQRPWWACPTCGEVPTGLAAVPVVGPWRRRRCPRCGAVRPQAWRPVVLGVVTGAAWASLTATIGLHAPLPAALALVAALVVAAAVDLERLIIPTRVVAAGVVVVAAALVVASAVDGRWSALGWAAVSAAVAFSVFFVVHAVVPHGMGFGDVRLAGLIGLGTGWSAPSHAFVAFLAAFVLGAVGGVVMMMATGQGRRAKVPFGPFLAAGALVALLGGSWLGHLVWPHG